MTYTTEIIALLEYEHVCCTSFIAYHLNISTGLAREKMKGLASRGVVTRAKRSKKNQTYWKLTK